MVEVGVEMCGNRFERVLVVVDRLGEPVAALLIPSVDSLHSFLTFEDLDLQVFIFAQEVKRCDVRAHE